MELHAKASHAGSWRGRAGSRTFQGLGRYTLLAALSLAALLLLAAPAFAVSVSERPLLFSFDGSDTSAGDFDGPRAVEIDQANGLVYVVDSVDGVIDKFDLTGKAQPFAINGKSSLNPSISMASNSFPGLAVDSYGPNPGRIYALQENGPVEAFSPTGQSLWQLGGLSEPCGLATDAAGHPWVGDYAVGSRQYATAGTPPAEIGLVSTPEVCRLDIDSAGNVYATRWNSAVEKYEEGGAKVTTIASGANESVAVDQSSPTGHVFVGKQGGGISEYDASGVNIGNYGTGGTDIAYSSTLDRVYATGQNPAGKPAINVYGSLVSGDAPGVKIEPATEVGLNTATLHGKADPDNLPDTSYRFEWKLATDPSWANKSPAQNLPVSDGEVSVAVGISDLQSSREYNARLVSINDITGFTLASESVTFTTPTPPKPTVSLDEPVPAGRSALVTATIDPQGDRSEWWMETSTDQACSSNFNKGKKHIIQGGESSGVEVEENIKGLLPGTHYCVRILATNGGGETFSEIEEFTTLSLPPYVTTAFAAPRTDTTARINARLNPNGRDVTYHFEFSDDGGVTWVSFSDQEDTSDSYDQLIVSHELSGLEPATTYSYRLSAESSIGTADPQGAVKTFTTRTTAEMHPPDRGIELVNNPDKGNQNVQTEQIGVEGNLEGEDALSLDGTSAAWSVNGGAPGGTTGSENIFIATRNASGWISKSMIPPAAKQFGGGDMRFRLVTTSPDLSRSILRTDQAVLASSDITVVRNDGAAQEVLTTFPNSGNLAADTTNDLAHVVMRDPATGVLNDYGTGTPEPVSLMANGQPACVEKDFHVGAAHWIATTDASRVYFVTESSKCPLTSEPGLYLHNRDDETTYKLAADGEFVRTTPDGRTALFVTREALADDDENSKGADIYRFSEGEPSQCLTCVVPDAEVGQEFKPAEAVRSSEDLSRIYFTSVNQLVPNEGDEGSQNLYVLREDGSIDFVAVVNTRMTTTRSIDLMRSSRMTPDGQVFVFPSTGSPTTDAVKSDCLSPGLPELHECLELYRYDDGDGSIECVSCVPGAQTNIDWVFAGGGLALSRDGSTVAFTTEAPLLPSDVNGAVDVYEWRNGKTRLITDGVTKFPLLAFPGRPRVRGVDAGGDTILFSVAGGLLTGFEQDGLSNLYAARVGGGFDPPPPTPHCSEEACQGPLHTAPSPAPLASSAFKGRGNIKPRVRKRRSCARKRGKVKRRCVRRQRARANVITGRVK